jgi:hypothetical protein
MNISYQQWSETWGRFANIAFHFDLEYTIRKVQKNHGRMNVNGTHWLLVNAANDNLVGKNINTLNKHTEARSSISH